MTALPEGITTAAVHMDAPLSFIGDPGRLHVEIESSASLVWTATGTPITTFALTMELAEGQELRVDLPHTDQVGFQDETGNAYTNWYYTARVTYEREGQLIVYPERDFQIPSGQTEVDLALVPAGTAAPVPQVAPAQTVTSVGGFTGAVTKAQLGIDRVNNTNDLEKPISTLAQAALDAKINATATRTNLFTNPSFETASGTVTVRTNLFTNPSFEVDTAGVTPSRGTLTRDTAVSYVGAASGKYVADGTAGGNYLSNVNAKAAVTAGEAYTMSAYVLRDATASKWQIRHFWYDSGGVLLSSNTPASYTTISDTSWTRISATATAPANAVTLMYYFIAEGAQASGATTWFDAILIEKNSLALPYFDGATPITNLCQNPGVETDITGWNANDINLYPITRSTVSPLRGTASILSTRQGTLNTTVASMYGNGLNPYTITALKVKPGEIFSGSVDVKVEQANRQVAVSFAFRNSAGTSIGSAGSVTTAVSNGVVTRVGTANVTVPVNADSMLMVVTVSTTNATNALNGERVWLDGFMIERSATINPYYEGTGDFSYAWSGTANASTSVQTAVPITGTVGNAIVPVRSARWKATGSYSLLLQPVMSGSDSFAALTGVTFATGKTYTVSATCYLATAQTGALDGTRSRSIVVYHSNTSSKSTAAPNAAGATRLSVTFTVTDGAAYQNLRLYNGASQGNGDVWWDDILVEESATMGTYFDGSTADTGDVYYDWTGTAHASTSTRKLTIESHIPSRLTDASLEGKYALLAGANDIEITDTLKGVVLKSPNATRWRITVGDDGVLTTTAL